MTPFSEEEGFLNKKLIIENLHLEKGFNIGDFGCGPAGHYMEAISNDIGEDGTIYAIDVQKNALNSIEGLSKQKGLHNVKTIWSDIEMYGATKIPVSTLDRALLINVLYQTNKHLEVIKEILRLLKISGEFLIIDWVDAQTPLGPPINMRITKQKICDLANRLNMVKKEEFEAGSFHYGLVFEKRF